MHVHLNHAAMAPGRPGRDYSFRARDACMPDAEFVELQSAYRPSGGLAHGDELASRLHVNGGGGYARLARWIVSRQVFSFSWNENFWVPMFQFDLTDDADRTLRLDLRPVLSELADVMDGSALARWFAQPNDELQGRSPVAMCSSHLPEVHRAARLQRFAMNG